MLITTSPFTLNNAALPIVHHSAGVVGYTHRWTPYEILPAVDAACLSWTDYVGGLALSATNGPTVKALADGRKYLQHDGGNDTIRSTSVPSGDVATVIMVARGRATDTGTTIYASGTGVSINRNGTTGTVINPGAAVNNPTKLDNTWRLVAAVATASDARLIIDGVKATATAAGIWGTALRLGANGTPANFSMLDVAEVITYPTALSDADIALVRTAMIAAYPALLT
ncbi:hypothetical protein ACFVSU_02620 [Microbacterium sp. NPDC058062]|uniref:hypothetical protein n=1 Tax=Microbacterium sp. NPDC058062 TaxID=3346320 RepID=UPI0036DDCC84